MTSELRVLIPHIRQRLQVKARCAAIFMLYLKEMHINSSGRLISCCNLKLWSMRVCIPIRMR